MTGYPYFYDNEDLNYSEKFMKFSLNPIKKNSKLKLPQLASLPIVVDPIKLGLGDEFTYQFCDQISQLCGTFRSIPETQTLLLDYNGFCSFANNSDTIINTISYELAITKESAMQRAVNFFSEKNVIVQADGVHGAFYKVGSYLQSAGSAGLVTHTLGLAKLAGVNGLQILKAQPILAVAIPTTGAIFFYGCGAIVGNNTLGKALISTGDVCALPMKGVEIIWNSYGNPVIQKAFGMPIILNMTQSFKTGPGYTIEEIRRYISINKKPLFKTIKEKIASWLLS